MRHTENNIDAVQGRKFSWYIVPCLTAAANCDTDVSLTYKRNEYFTLNILEGGRMNKLKWAWRHNICTFSVHTDSYPIIMPCRCQRADEIKNFTVINVKIANLSRNKN